MLFRILPCPLGLSFDTYLTEICSVTISILPKMQLFFVHRLQIYTTNSMVLVLVIILLELFPSRISLFPDLPYLFFRVNLLHCMFTLNTNISQGYDAKANEK